MARHEDEEERQVLSDEFSPLATAANGKQQAPDKAHKQRQPQPSNGCEPWRPLAPPPRPCAYVETSLDDLVYSSRESDSDGGS